jgi:hypothetical protein
MDNEQICSREGCEEVATTTITSINTAISKEPIEHHFCQNHYAEAMQQVKDGMLYSKPQIGLGRGILNR